MNLREQMSADVAGVFCRTADFAETGTYVPKGGTPRSVNAIVDVELTRVEQQGSQRYRVETLRVWCSQDPVTGIDNPQDGDGYAREGDDPNVKVYSFRGEIGDVDDNTGWTLTFIHKVPLTVGGNRMPR
jgi:hypothetical protein